MFTSEAWRYSLKQFILIVDHNVTSIAVLFLLQLLEFVRSTMEDVLKYVLMVTMVLPRVPVMKATDWKPTRRHA